MREYDCEKLVVWQALLHGEDGKLADRQSLLTENIDGGLDAFFNAEV